MLLETKCLTRGTNSNKDQPPAAGFSNTYTHTHIYIYICIHILRGRKRPAFTLQKHEMAGSWSASTWPWGVHLRGDIFGVFSVHLDRQDAKALLSRHFALKTVHSRWEKVIRNWQSRCRFGVDLKPREKTIYGSAPFQEQPRPRASANICRTPCLKPCFVEGLGSRTALILQMITASLPTMHFGLGLRKPPF